MKEVIKQFEAYVHEFDLTNFDLERKYRHSYRVMKLMEQLAHSLKLSEEDVTLACIIGLLHDIGRFEQLKEVDSYDDTKFEHADFGTQYLKTSHFLEQCHVPDIWYPIIFTAVQYHNKYDIPEYLDEKTLLFTKLIRDADKIDILRLTIEKKQESTGEVRQQVMDEFYQKKQIHILPGFSKKEFVFVRLGFLYDLNFRKSFELVKEDDFLNKYYEVLDRPEELKEYFDFSRVYLEQQLKEEEHYVRYKI